MWRASRTSALRRERSTAGRSSTYVSEKTTHRATRSQPHDLSVIRVAAAPAALPRTTGAPTRAHHRLILNVYPKG